MVRDQASVSFEERTHDADRAADAPRAVLFLAWAFTPEETMRALGVTYYPAKWWALAAPSWLCALVVYVYVAYGSLNLLSVVPPASLRAVTDRDAALTHGRESPVPGGLPPAGDVPLSEVCALLHAARTAP